MGQAGRFLDEIASLHLNPDLSGRKKTFRGFMDISGLGQEFDQGVARHGNEGDFEGIVLHKKGRTKRDDLSTIGNRAAEESPFADEGGHLRRNHFLPGLIPAGDALGFPG